MRRSPRSGHRVRERHPRHAGAWNFLAEAFESAGEDATAAEGYTAGVTHALGVGSLVTADAVEDAQGSFDVETLFIGRHRVRRLLGEPHDDWDDVADGLHRRRASPLHGRLRPLDELHDPIRMKRLAEGGPDALQAEMEAMADELSDLDDVPTGQASLQRTCVLYWPQEEFPRLLERWPNVADSYGDDHAAHLRQVERVLRELSDQGAVRLAVGRATVTGLETHAKGGGASLDTSQARSAYAAELARTGRTTDWPPPRNGPCWCGSERKYKKCCGNPALA